MSNKALPLNPLSVRDKHAAASGDDRVKCIMLKQGREDVGRDRHMVFHPFSYRYPFLLYVL